MSMGYGASCRKAAEDDKTLIYEYSVYNLNQDDWLDMMELYDGMILIDKVVFKEPFIPSKEKIIFSGLTVENCSRSWKLSEDGIDCMAIRLFYKIFNIYSKRGIFVESISVDY